jgi:uncharacterized protein (UPF0335 family)
MDGSYHIDTALRGFVDRIVEQYKARDDINGDIREIYGEVKEAGFVVSVVRGMVREYRMDAEARAALYQHQNEYRVALGLSHLEGTPLGDAALEAEAIELGETMRKPTPFAEQPVHKRPRGRPRKDAAPSNGSRPMFDA